MTCPHDDARLEFTEKHGQGIGFWVSCPECGAHWDIQADLQNDTAHVSREESQ